MQVSFPKTIVAQRYPYGIVGKSNAMKKIRWMVERAGRNGASVLITGETGTGKEVVAQGLYEARSNEGPFITVNTCAINDGLAESELFGHVRGAFTGAIANKRGYFELAHEGILFLDEIGDMSLTLQGKLLRAIEQGVFYPVGGQKPIKTEVKIVAATNREVTALVKEGKFREDLYHRIRTIEITLPPLRERLEDVPELVEHFIQLYNYRHASSITITDEAMALLGKHAAELILGNVRGLQVFIDRAATFAEGTEITPANDAFSRILLQTTLMESTKNELIRRIRKWAQESGPFNVNPKGRGGTSLSADQKTSLCRALDIDSRQLERLIRTGEAPIKRIIHEERGEEIQRLTAKGLNLKEIAEQLGIAYSTLISEVKREKKDC